MLKGCLGIYDEHYSQTGEILHNIQNNDLKSKQLGEYLQKMKVIIQTPMRSQFHQEGDIPTQYTRTLAKIYNQLHHLLYNTGKNWSYIR